MENANYQAGFAAHGAGVKWWNNPHPSGSIDAYEWDQGHTAARQAPVARLAAIRAAIENESVSYGEIAELQAIAEANPAALADDVLLREWAGLPESETPAYPATDCREYDWNNG